METNSPPDFFKPLFVLHFVATFPGINFPLILSSLIRSIRSLTIPDTDSFPLSSSFLSLPQSNPPPSSHSKEVFLGRLPLSPSPAGVSTHSMRICRSTNKLMMENCRFATKSAKDGTQIQSLFLTFTFRAPQRRKGCLSYGNPERPSSFLSFFFFLSFFLPPPRPFANDLFMGENKQFFSQEHFPSLPHPVFLPLRARRGEAFATDTAG